MKNAILLFVLLPFLAVGQVDTVKIEKKVDSLIRLSRGHTGKNEFEEALRVNTIAEQLTLEKLGRESGSYGKVCFNHGRILYFKGDYENAEERYLESKSIREGVKGKGKVDYAASLFNLGVLYYKMGNYEKAETHYMDASVLFKKVLGEEHPYYAMSLGNLGALYRSMGNYSMAELTQLEALNLKERSLGKENLSYAISLESLGILYEEMGIYDRAELLLLEALVVMEKAIGKEHPDYAGGLINLGGVYDDISNYNKAESVYLDALTILEKAVGKEHPDYALNLHNLGTLYYNMGEYGKAESMHLESLTIYEKVLGKEHPRYALSLANLGRLYQKMGNYDKIEPLYLKALDIREKALGKEHSSYAISLRDMGKLYQYIGQHDKAEMYWQEANEIDKSLLTKAISHLSDKELSSYIKLFTINLNHISSYAQIRPRLVRVSLDNILFYKGFLLNATQQANKLVLGDSIRAEKHNLLKSYHRRLAAEYAKPIAERQNVEELEEKANTLEKELVRTVAGYGDAIRQVEWQEVRDALQPGEAAVEFVHYNYYTPDPTDSVMYAALVLRPGDEAPHFIPLFEEKELQALLQENPIDKKAFLNELYNHKKKKATSSSLHQLIWQPLEELLAGAETVYASPSGLLHRINLRAVMVNRKKVWGDRHELVLMGSTRQLAIRRNSQFAVFTRPRHEDGRSSPDQVVGQPSAVHRPPSAGSLSATLYGGIHYEMDSTAIARANQGEPPIASIGGELPFFPLERSERGRLWEELPGTVKEAEEIAAIIKKQKGEAEALKGYNATEESFKRLGQDGPSPRILHIATHGYFYSDPSSNEAANSPAFGGGRGEAVPFKISEHPMIRSGLAMAGGNQAWRGKPVPEGLEDGILTAYEVSQVDLRNTELVVLSACETGLGDIEGNEGVYGLQRAFKIAGADKLIMSLWNVPDAQTQEMMVLFYRYWLEEGMELSEAFRAAQGEMRKRYGEHYYWAAFVLVE
ncbi:MAG: CHAT domain-containing protein [Lewinellaceae bacterium]|nr:CHAT domain-containing protein [Lewinellaceae bacterium]